MIKIVHTADLHLDTAFSAVSPEQAVQRRREQRQALALLAKECSGCDLVLLAGDLFDSARVYQDTIDALKVFFSAIDAEVFIAPGNHDFVASGSPYLTENWGNNVHIFTKSEIECVHLEALHCDVYGAGFTSAEAPNLLAGFRVGDPEALNLMVLHGDLQPNSPYDPITPEDIAFSGLDYLALGHIHTGFVKRCGQTTCAMPGCLMGRGFDECGQKGVLRVTLEKNACQTDFIPIPTRRYEILSVEAGDDPLAAIRAALPAQTQEDCYRILLTGEAEHPDTDALESLLAPLFYSISVRDQTYPKQALWAASGEDTLRGHLLHELKAQYDTADEAGRRTIALAARLVTNLMDGREAGI